MQLRRGLTFPVTTRTAIASEPKAKLRKNHRSNAVAD
jgi:hypothetical protein